jgi:autophagy-related protein 18
MVRTEAMTDHHKLIKKAICALSPSSERNYMAYPQPSKQPPQQYSQPAHAPPTADYLPPSTGELLIFDANKLEALNVIEAHHTTLSCAAINNSGTMVATASEKGTIIRVFDVPDGNKLFQFRRGSLPAQIFCMSFNATSSLLSVSSATETIHIFKLEKNSSPVKSQDAAVDASPSSTGEQSPGPRSRGESFSSYRERSGSPSDDDGVPSAADMSPSQQQQRPTGQVLARMIRRASQNVGLQIAQRMGGYLPSSVQEMWEPQRDFAWVKVPRLRSSSTSTSASLTGSTINPNPVKSVVAMSTGHPQLLVVTSEGQFLVYNVDLEKGGEGVLEREVSYVKTLLPMTDTC